MTQPNINQEGKCSKYSH